VNRIVSGGVLCSIVLLASSSQPALATAPDTTWPPITSESKPWTRWWWLGSAVDEENLKRELAAIAMAGFGGVEITPIYGVKGAEGRFLEFLSPAYVAAIKTACSEAQRLGLRVDMATGTGWPFGGPQVGPDDAELKIAGPDGVFSPQPTRFKVKRAAPGGAGFVVNPFSPAAVRRYLERFTVALVDVPRGAIHGQFHDSFEYQANWSPEVPAAFQAMHGYDIDTRRDALEGRGDPDTVARVKADYRATLAALHMEALKVWIDWAHGQGSIAREQAHGAPANLIDLYAAADVPETEVFGASHFPIPGFRRAPDRVSKNRPQPLVTRFASSAAHLAGRSRTSSETFTWLREHFCAAPAQMKPEIDQLFLAGINQIFYHGTAYSPADAPWPGWLFYASTQANPRNPLWQELGAVNLYIARAQSLLQAGEPDNDLLVYWPIHDLLHSPAGWQRNFSMHGHDWLEQAPTGQLAESLLAAGLSFDFCSDALLSEAGRYRSVVVPPCRLLPGETLQRLIDHAESGGTVIFVERFPDDVPGLGRLAERRAAFAAEWERLAWRNLDGGVRQAAVGTGRLWLVPDAAGAVLRAGGRVEPLAAAGLGVVRRKMADGQFYFLANLGAEAFDGWAKLATPARGAVFLEPLSGRAGVAVLRGAVDEAELALQLQPGQSIGLRTYADRAAVGPPWEYGRSAGAPVAVTGKWTVTPVMGGPELPPSFTTDQLGSWTRQGGEWERFAGTARYEIELEIPPGAADWLLELGDLREAARVRLDGQEIGHVWSLPFAIRLGEAARPGRHRLAIDVTNLAANRIRDLDRRGVAWKNFHEINFVDVHYKPFNAADWPLAASGLIGPVQMVPFVTNVFSGSEADDDRPIEQANPLRMAEPADPDLPSLFLVGDSTVKCGTKGQRGWGEEIGKYLDPSRVNLVNHAIGGRSSRTFITEGRWETTLSMMKPGDFVIIQFGHNDGGPLNDDSRARGSIRGTGTEVEEIDNLLTRRREIVRTYGAYLRQYVNDARSKGVTPYLCTPVPRKMWEQDNARIIRPGDGPVVWARTVAAEEDATLLDLYETVASVYDSLGPEGVEPFFADARTHTTVDGADFTARTVIGLLEGLPDTLWPEVITEAAEKISELPR
jgi:lysophospholipase L1-like esterase